MKEYLSYENSCKIDLQNGFNRQNLSFVDGNVKNKCVGLLVNVRCMTSLLNFLLLKSNRSLLHALKVMNLFADMS